MKMIWQAIRAATVETMGVAAVVFMLFGAAGWTAESAGVSTRKEADRAWQWLQESAGTITATIKPDVTPDERQRFAASRLDHYGQVYGETAGSYAKQAVEQLRQNNHSDGLPRNQLLGTL